MMHKVKANKGRPPKHTYEDLKKLLLEYAKANMTGKLTISGFAGHSGIPRSTIRYYKNITVDIDNLNKQDIFCKKGYVFEIPPAEEIIKNNSGKKLTKAITELINAYNHALEDNLKIQKLEEKNRQLNMEINLLKERNKALLESNEFYQNEVKKMTIQSTSLKERKKYNIKQNYIDLEKYSKTETTFKDLFDE